MFNDPPKKYEDSGILKKILDEVNIYKLRYYIDTKQIYNII